VSDEAAIGDNSGLNQQDKTTLQGIVSEIERLDEEMLPLREDRATIFRSAKDKGFNVKALRAVIRERRMERAEREALETTKDIYKHALGMLGPLADLPLGQAHLAAVEKTARKRSKKPLISNPDRPDTSDQPF
jgi:uncharacterized protein (UPF0335 family)